jgi:hypothetical protein
MPLRKTLERKPLADPDVWDFLHDRYPSDSEPYNFEVFSLLGDSTKLESIWCEYQSEILESYISKYPGKRVSHWWTFDGPQVEVKWPGVSRITEPRRLISGYCFLPWANKKALKPNYYKAIPNVSKIFDVYDLNEPAYFESEASYLQRHGLLLKNESQLTEHAFAPVNFLDVMMERRALRPY